MSSARNPYAPPNAEVADPRLELIDDALIPNGRRVPAGNGVQWIGDAMRLYFGRPWKWIGVMLLLFLISLVAAFIPLSNIVSTLLWPAVGGGLMFAMNVQRQTGSFTLGNVFSGFGPRFVPLAIVGATMLLMYPIMFVSIMVFVGGDVAGTMMLGGTDLDPARFMTMNFLLAMLVYLLFALPIGAATYLAPALIMLHDVKPGAAMKMSFIAVFKNILPGLVFGVAMLLLLLVSLIPLLLGLLISFPVAMITMYTMYRDIFVQEA